MDRAERVPVDPALALCAARLAGTRQPPQALPDDQALADGAHAALERAERSGTRAGADGVYRLRGVLDHGHGHRLDLVQRGRRCREVHGYHAFVRGVSAASTVSKRERRRGQAYGGAAASGGASSGPTGQPRAEVVRCATTASPARRTWLVHAPCSGT